jgi:hypothetical protein
MHELAQQLTPEAVTTMASELVGSVHEKTTLRLPRGEPSRGGAQVAEEPSDGLRRVDTAVALA